MFHVPGQYSGGTSDGLAWTQTKGEVEVRVPLPPKLADGGVHCSILPRSYSLWWEGAGEEVEAKKVGGELIALVVVDDSLWSVETSGANKVAVVSLRKAVPELWTKLCVTDDESREAPRLLDGLERKAPRSKQELLQDAKARAAATIDEPSRAKQYVLEGRASESVALLAEDLPPLPVVTVRNCTDCQIVLSPALTAVKLMLEGCARCTLTLEGKVLTETFEAWRCEACALHTSSPLKTVQVDACTGLQLSFAQAAHFQQLLTTGAHDLSLSFADAPGLNGRVDFGELCARMPEHGLSTETDQFITRVVEDTLTTELIIRLSNDFPTTEREVADFAERTKVHADKLDEVVDGMLGTSLGRSLTEAEREQMKAMVREQSDEASAAQQVAEQTAEGRHKARVEFKQKAGNDAFKSADYQQAAVLYTEAIALDEGVPALFSNRAACFLKLGRYAQAREDAEKAIALKPDFAKGHFRRALALQAEEKFADACAAFNQVLKIEPKNKDAASGLRMAEVQAERQRRQQAAV